MKALLFIKWSMAAIKDFNLRYAVTLYLHYMQDSKLAS